MDDKFFRIPLHINHISQVYTPKEINAYYSIKQHYSESDAEYETRINRLIDDYVTKSWKNSKNYDSLTTKQQLTEKRKNKCLMRKWIREGSGRHRVHLVNMLQSLEVLKSKALVQNAKKMYDNSEKKQIIYQTELLNIDYKSLADRYKRESDSKDKIIERLKKLAVEKDNEIIKLKRGDNKRCDGDEVPPKCKTFTPQNINIFTTQKMVNIEDTLRSHSWWFEYEYCKKHNKQFISHGKNVINKYIDKIVELSNGSNDLEKLDICDMFGSILGKYNTGLTDEQVETIIDAGVDDLCEYIEYMVENRLKNEMKIDENATAKWSSSDFE